MEKYKVYGNPYATCCILQMQGQHELEMLDQELEIIAKKYEIAKEDILNNSEVISWCIIAVPINDWDKEMSPWPMDIVERKEQLAAEAVAGKSYKCFSLSNREFGAGAKDKLSGIIDEIIPDFEKRYQVCGNHQRHYALAGYSLAGLFALWASYQTDMFDGIAAMSPSVWYPDWIDYAKSNECRADRIYLSLGSKEHKTRNRMMATVADAIREQQDILNGQNKATILQWNEGNHFANVPERIAKGIIWLIG